MIAIVDRLVLLTTTAALLTGLLGTPVAALPPIPAVACPVVSHDDAPKLDGVMDEPAWQKAEVQTRFYRYYGRLERPQEMRLITDGQWLYVGFTAFEPGIAAKDLESVNVFVAPSKASDQFVSFALDMNAKGFVKSKPPLGETQDFKAAFGRHDDRWVVELAIRATPVFGSALRKGKVFDFNLDRTRYEAIGDTFDVLQQWSNTGTSSGERYRFGEVTVGRAADRLPMIRSELKFQIELARSVAGDLSNASRGAFEKTVAAAERLIAMPPGEGAITTADVQAYALEAEQRTRALQHAVLADRGAFVWACNPMAVPLSDDLPSPDQPSAERLEVRVLGGEFESAALVVTNLTNRTLDGQVLIGDFIAGDASGEPVRRPGRAIVDVRTAPLYHMKQSNRHIRDPLPVIQQGGWFRVVPQQNELLWLTFKSRGLPPGKYTATMTIRSHDDQLLQPIELVLRVYPLALGAAGRPRVHVWNPQIKGRDWAERAAHNRDYYLTCDQHGNRDDLPQFTADAQGNVLSEHLDFTRFDRFLDQVMQTGADTYLITVEAHRQRFWPMRLESQKWFEPDAKSLGTKRWSARFNEIFHKWVVAFRAHMEAKGLPPNRWAFYIMDEPASGEELQEVIEFARQAKKADPEVRNYITLPIRHGHDAQYIEASKYLDLIQLIGTQSPKLRKTLQQHAGELWSYTINLRGSNPFYSYRVDVCWVPMHRGDLGTGFWVWDSHSEVPLRWRDGTKRTKPPGVRFGVIYDDHDGGIVPSLRTEAFREGIEDWKYLIMLDEALARGKAKGVAAEVLAAAAEFRAGCFDRLEGPDTVYLLRDEARAHLMRLHVVLGELDPDEVATVEQN